MSGMSFDRLAPYYRWLERAFAGEKLQRCRVALLHQLPTPQRVLIYGEGNGRFLLAFLQCFPEAHVTVVDASAVMLRLAQERLARHHVAASRVHFVLADALEWQHPAATFDLIVTCFFFDCFTASELEPLIPKIAASSTEHASWLVADFQLAPSGWRRLYGRCVVALLYHFFRRTTRLSAHELVDTAPYLRGCGFQCTSRVEQEHALLFSACWRKSV